MHRHAVVTGGAGFVGSHLCDRLLADGWRVTVLDNLCTGRPENIAHLVTEPAFRFVEHDVTRPLAPVLPAGQRVDAVLHLASPASPPDYLRLPLETLQVGSIGTLNALELAAQHRARFLLASTSETYGDPLVHPQPETYWGNVNPVGPRSVYDEAKRFAEAATTAYRTSRGVDTAIVRIFNTFGPRMRTDDGRAIPTFIDQALHGRPITVAGDGSQTRSITYVEDLVEGLVRLLASGHSGPMNIGNPYELAMVDLAMWIRDLCSSCSPIAFVARPTDDPSLRRPDIRLAQSVLGWEPQVPAAEALRRTIAHFLTQLGTSELVAPAAVPLQRGVGLASTGAVLAKEVAR